MAVNNLFGKAKCNMVKKDSEEEGNTVQTSGREDSTKVVLAKLNKINSRLQEFKFVTERFNTLRKDKKIANDKKMISVLSNMKGNAHIIGQMMENGGKTGKGL